MELFGMISLLKSQYALEIEKKNAEIKQLQTKMEVLDDLSSLCVANEEETEKEIAQTNEEGEYPVEEQMLDESY